MVDEALGGDRCTDPLVDELRHFDDAVALREPRFNPVTHMELRRCLCMHTVDLDVSAPACIGGGGARLAEPHRPQPPVDPGRLHIFMVARAWATCSEEQPCCADPDVRPRDPDSVYAHGVEIEVDRFVESLGESWQREACANLLGDIRTSARLSEHIKWGHPYFDYEGSAVLKWFCAKNWINVYFFRGRELSDPRELFEASDNHRMLTVKIHDANGLDRGAFRDLVRAAAVLAGDS